MADRASVRELERRHPALEKLSPRRQARRIPVIQQMHQTECGAACLAMVLGFHGRSVRLDELRGVLKIGRDGTTVRALLDAANAFGLRGRGVRVDLAELRFLTPGTIVHWEFNHFVVFERVRGQSIDIVDPALGRRRVTLEQFDRSFTGVALLLEPADTFAAGAQGPRRIWTRMRDIIARSGQWGGIIVTSLLGQLFALALPVLTGAVVDRVVPHGDWHLLLTLAFGLAGLVAFYFVSTMMRAHLLIQLRTIVDARMTLGFLDHLLRLPYAYFQRRPTGDLMMRINSNATIREMLTSGLLSTVLDGGLVTVYLLVIFVASTAFGFLVTVLALLQLSVLLASRRRQHELMAQSLHTQARSESYLVELLAGMETLKSMGSELRAGDHWSSLFVDQLNVSLERSRLSALVDSLNGTLKIASPLIILLFSAVQVLDGTMSLGTVLALCALAGAFLGPLGSLVATATQLQLLGSYLQRIEDVLDTEPEQVPDRPRPVTTLRGQIALHDVSFSYTPHTPPVLRDVSVEIRAGDFVAIVGRSGSGKSTLASLLLGLYKPDAGNISYDGVDLASLDLRALRQQVGIVNQRAHVFGSSVRSNIAMSDPQITLDDVVAAARHAQIDEEIRAMPMGYDTLLTDGGASLSGGQRQRVALARALVRRPAILMLDEATAALDAVTERAVQQQLEELSCTRIVIAHRLSTIREADLILVMEDGRVVERGTHTELVAQNGAYARLIAVQLESTSL